MKTLKGVLALVLGSVLGLLSSCGGTGSKNEAPAPSGKSAGPQTNTVPQKQENLPVDRPIYE
jgi:hypothetical protein